MKLTFLGTGSAFTLTNYHSNMLLDVDGARLLIDCGGDARHAMRDLSVTSTDVDAVYISHLHADHVGGMEWLAFSTYFQPDADRPRLITHASLVDELWRHCLQGGLGKLQDQETRLATFFDVTPVGDDSVSDALEAGSFDFAGVTFQLVRTVHFTIQQSPVYTYGLSWRTPGGQQMLLTTDTRFDAERLAPAYAQADVIFHDCETGGPPSGFHAHFSELAELPEPVRRKMWLYHYQDGRLPDATAAGFAGFVQRGQTFVF